MLSISVDKCTNNIVTRLIGVLDDRTYRQVHDAVIKAAVDGLPAVIIDVDGLEVHSDRCWAVFTRARWRVPPWPDVDRARVQGPAGSAAAHGPFGRPLYPRLLQCGRGDSRDRRG
jgi:hypothetical protein